MAGHGNQDNDDLLGRHLDPIEDQPRCDVRKAGRFAPLRCVRPKGHDGPHNFVPILGYKGDRR